MKKLLLLILVLMGMVCTASAEKVITIYFQPNGDWAKSDATFKLYGYANSGDADAGSVKDMSLYVNYGNKIYYATMDVDAYPVIRFGRYASNGTDFWNKTAAHYFTPNVDTYFIMTGSNFQDWNAYDCNSSTYLPCNYYFTSNKDSWASATKMSEETAGTFTHTFNAKDYAGKYFVWAPGYAFTNAGAMSDWTKAIRPKNTTDEYPGYKVNHWTTFQNLVYSDETGSTMRIFDGTDAADANLWYVPSSHENDIAYLAEGTITISFVKASNSATISPKKNVSISGEGWATYSNSENYKVSGATAYIITAVGSTATLTALSADAEIPGGTGIMLKGNEGSYDVTPSDGTATISGNLLMGSNNYTFNITGEYYGTNYDGYVLSGSGETLGFYPVNPSSNTLGIHKAFLKINKTSARPFDFISLNGGNTTGIANINANENSDANAPMYNLAGQRVSKCYKGVVIVNGKKMLNK